MKSKRKVNFGGAHSDCSLCLSVRHREAAEGGEPSFVLALQRVM